MSKDQRQFSVVASCVGFVAALVLAVFSLSARAADLVEGQTFRDYFLGGIQLGPHWIVVSAVIAGLFGMVSHWWKKNARDEADVSFMDWFIWSKFKNTLAAMATLVAGVVTAILPLEIAQTTLYSALILGFTMGYAADSAVNNGESTPSE